MQYNGEEMRRTEIKKSMMVDALHEYRGCVLRACTAANVSRDTHYRWVKIDQHYQQQCASIYKKFNAVLPAWIEADTPGALYVIRCEGTRWVKIGRSKNAVQSRLSSMQSGCPLKLELVAIIEAPKHKNAEVQMHEKYKHRRGIGEWFEIHESEMPELINMMSEHGAVKFYADE